MRPRRPAHGGLTRRNGPSTAALLAPAEDGARAGPLQGLVACVRGGVRASAAYGGERWHARVHAGPWRAAATKAIGEKGRADGSSARHRGGHHGVALGGHHGVVVGVVGDESDEWGPPVSETIYVTQLLERE